MVFQIGINFQPLLGYHLLFAHSLNFSTDCYATNSLMNTYETI